MADGYRPDLARLLRREAPFLLVPNEGGPLATADSEEWHVLREQIVVWFIDAAIEYALSQAVVAIAVSVLDRFARKHVVQPALVGALTAACLSVAAKVTEDEPPSLVGLSIVACSDPLHVASVEASVLSALDWRVPTVTPHEVCVDMLRALGATLHASSLRTLETLALAACLERQLVGVAASAVGCAALVLALDYEPTDTSAMNVRAATLRVNTFVLARDSGFNMDGVEHALGVLRASLQVIIQRNVERV